MDPDHKRYIPSTYWKQILCSIDYTHNEELFIVVCTKQADLIEFQIDNENNDVKNTNCIDIDYSNVNTMKVFFALNESVGIFYLLHTSGGELVVVEKLKKTLKIKEKIHRVQKFDISDVNNRGRPEVSIWYMNSKEPNLVTDFSDQLIEQGHSDGPCDKLANCLKIQLKMLTDKISGKQALLEDKMKFRDETARSLFRGSEQANLKINSCRQRIFSDKLFIVMELENNANISIVDLKLVLNLKSNLTLYKSFFIETDTPQISEIRTLTHKCLGVVMLDIPVSSSENLILAGTLYYQVKNDRNLTQSVNLVESDETITNNVTSGENSVTKLAQDTKQLSNRLLIPSVELDANRLLDISCQCHVGVNTTVQDLYCIMLALFEKEFIILKMEPLLEMLTTRLRCFKLSVQTGDSSYYYCDQGIFNEHLFSITNSNCLSVYYKNESQITLISILLKDIVKEKEESSIAVDVSKFQTDVSHCLELLRNEILHDTIGEDENPRNFFNVEKKHLFEIQKILSKYQSVEK
uniref:Uncharacterized protein n=1 Tax=Cacopsylla melanoneura TaxID=428564 RepID=A0A8D8SZ37_9HEMI